MKKKIIITGVRGLIGFPLAVHLIDCGYEVIGLIRKGSDHVMLTEKGIRICFWGDDDQNSWVKEVDGSYAIINLAGENIGSGRWTEIKKMRILESRIQSILNLRSAIFKAEKKPEIFIQASAIGYYGTQTEKMIDESFPSGDGFLAEVCSRIEKEAKLTGVPNPISIRIGVVLAGKGGALARIVKSMKTGIAGYPGSGDQMISWIHLNDVVYAIRHLIEQQSHKYVYNLTSPESASMKHIVKYAASLKGTILSSPIPSVFLKILFGRGMVNETLLANQWIFPKALMESGFSFRFPGLKDALKDLLA